MFLKKIRHQEQLITLVILILTNFILKILYLDYHSLGGDEPFTVYHAQMSASSIIRLLSEGNNPPLFELILHYWIKIFGISPFSVRFPSLIFSCITVGFIYTFGYKFLNKKIGLYAAVIYIFSNYHVVLASESRAYALIGMLSILSMYVFVGIISRIETGINNKSLRSNVFLLLLFNTLLIYAHYFGFFILATQFLFVFLNGTLRKKIGRLAILIGFAILVLYIPNIMVVLYRAIDSTTNGTWIKSPEGISSLYNMLRQFTNAPILTFLFLLISIISILKGLKHITKTPISIAKKLVIFWFCFIFLTMFFASFWVPMFMDRYLMPAAIGFTLVVGLALDYIIHLPKLKVLVPISICVLFMATYNPKKTIANKLNVKETITKLKEIRTNKTLTYFCPNWFELNFAYYYNIAYFKDYNEIHIKDNIYKYLAQEHIYPIADSTEITAINSDSFNQILYLDAAANLAFPNNGIFTKLNKNYTLNETYTFPEIFKLYVFKVLKSGSN